MNKKTKSFYMAIKTKIILLLLTSINSNNIFSKTRKTSLRKEMVISNPSLLLKLSFKNVSQNYPNTENSYNAFYKETVIKNSSLLNSSEAILDIVKSPYCSSECNKIIVSDVRGVTKSNDLENYVIKLHGGPLNCLECDVLKQPFLGTFLNEIEDKFEFSYKKSEKSNGKEIYVLDFKQKPGVRSSIYEGEIFIDSSSCAIVRVNYSMDVKNREWAYDRFFHSIPKKSKINLLSASYKIAYKEYNSKWYLDYSSTNICFNILNKSDSTSDIYNFNTSIAVTGIFSVNLIIDKRDFLKISDLVLDNDQVKKYYDKWDQYNEIMTITSANY